ncbi:MAG: pseudouridine synthase [Treponema sp.]|nr:rRNA pseudouridine synthase [Treponema sp.]MCI6317183.1 rRNA pseudouridine synthase [Spirochaetia bacterium]MCI6545177.1 rRNA pseudouridine synthase [Spirochaetia bacterium]MDY2824663.1 pseudouridine synthase [Treponema sp.]
MKMRNRDLNFQDNEKNKDEIRLQVYLAHCGVASRRACEKIIADGRVTVNGETVCEMGAKVSEKDEICVDGKKVYLEEIKRYVLLNKPAGYVCSLSDEKDRPVAADLLKEKYSERLYNIGRLDMFSQGLIIFTNDGDFAATLSHPSAELEKEYVVDASMPLPRTLCQEFEKGIRVDGVFYKCKSAHELNARKIKIVLVEGKNREIRNVFASKEIGIKRLTRVRIGNIEIKDLKPGEFRELSQKEVQGLLKLCKKTEKY